MIKQGLLGILLNLKQEKKRGKEENYTVCYHRMYAQIRDNI